MTGRTVVVLAIAFAGLVTIFVVIYLLGRYRSAKHGGRGFVQRSRLTCPKCHGTFDYTWVPGGALTAVRLGPSRYMRCPICHRWSVFNVWSAQTPEEATAGCAADPPPT